MEIFLIISKPVTMTDTDNSVQRVSCKRPHPNPLFQEWLENLYQDAVKENTEYAEVLKEALTSLSKYPLPLNSGAECAILKGFDKNLCNLLDMHLNEHRQSEKRAKVGKDVEQNVIEQGPSAIQEITNAPATESTSSGKSTKTKKKTKKLVTNSKKCPSTGIGESNLANPTNNVEITNDTNSNIIMINHNANNMPVIDSLNHPYIDNIDKKGIICMQCDLTSGTRKKETLEKQLLRKVYKPTNRSGGFAILMALMEQPQECPYRECLTKEELIQKAQKYCDTSFIVPKPKTDYTAWINAKRLINKGLLQVVRCPTVNNDVYMLTELGRIVAADIVKESATEITINDIIFHGQPNDRVPSLEDMIITPSPPPVLDEVQSLHPVFIEMPCGTFEVILLIDVNETGGLGKKNDPTTTLFNKYNDFKHEFRSLKVGDFTWIARSKKTGHELVLPYIIERKRMDDFGASIKDGRFHEQKFRLRKCGLEHVIYLIENHGSNKNVGLPMTTLMQAMVNTSVQDGFMVHRTDSLYHTIRFIAMVTQRLINKLQYVFLRGCNRDTDGKELMTFEFFNKSSSKNKPLTVREMFIKMLLQLKGISVEKALAITNKYSTPRVLMNAYDKCTEKEGEMLLANLKANNLSRNVGPAVSKTIYMLFTKLEL